MPEKPQATAKQTKEDMCTSQPLLTKKSDKGPKADSSKEVPPDSAGHSPRALLQTATIQTASINSSNQICISSSKKEQPRPALVTVSPAPRTTLVFDPSIPDHGPQSSNAAAHSTLLSGNERHLCSDQRAAGHKMHGAMRPEIPSRCGTPRCCLGSKRHLHPPPTQTHCCKHRGDRHTRFLSSPFGEEFISFLVVERTVLGHACPNHRALPFLDCHK